ncbi:SDR family NAD(P)-dependent oxidoreductase [Microbacterium sp. NPDC057650]|uniref:SDR family NAD(P)-dependent oxidoreductase n=1 Tax=unclassified Microbacterium TaxID=2609290 RepID=UPI00366CE404
MNAPAVYPDLDGRVAVVTGGSRGIGAATALALGANGVRVAVVGRDQEALDRTVAELSAQGSTALGVLADCTVEADLARLAGTVAERLGPPDILAAFAGGNGMPVPTAQENGVHWREVLDSDLTSVFLTISAFLPGMLECGGGTIITMSSSAGRQAAKSSAAYAAAKAGVVALTRHLAGEYGPQGIRINSIAPASVENDRMRAWTTEEQRQEMGATFPLGRIGRPDDVAATALFLASEASGWITGVTVDVTGGKVML